MAGFEKIPGLAPDLDRVQANIQAALAAIPAPASFNAVSVSKDYTATGAEAVIHVDASRGSVRITLPPTSAGNPPLTIQQVNRSGTFGTVTIVAAKAAKSIAGANAIALDASGTGSVTLTCDGVSWWPSSGGALVPAPTPNQPIPPQSGAGVLTTKPPLLGGGPMSKNITLSISPATETDAGTMSAADKVIIDNLPNTFPPISRVINTTSPLTGGGALTADLTLAIAANGIDATLFRQSSASSLVGNPTGSTADVTDITLGAGLAFSGSNLVNTAPADHKVSIDGSDTTADFLAAKLTATLPVTLTVNGSGGGGPPTTGLKLWLKADAGVTQGGGSVSAWADQSGNGNDVTASGAQPAFNSSSINGLPGITFTGAEILTRASSPLAAGNTPRTIIIVNKTATSFSGGCIMSLGQSGPWFGPTAYAFGTSGMFTYLGSSGFGTFTSTDTTAYGAVPLVVEVGWPGSGPITYNMNANPLTITGADGNADSHDFLTVGNYWNGGAPGGIPYDGDICEILVYDHVLSGGDLTAVRQYLQARYAISLGVSGGGSGGDETLNIAALYDNASITLNVSNQLQRAALTGDVTAAAGSNTTAIASHAVTYGQMQEAGAATLLGNPTGSTADISEITLGAGLTFTGTTLVNTSPLSDLAVTAPIALSGTTLSLNINSTLAIVSSNLGLPNVGPGAGTYGGAGVAGFQLDAQGRVTVVTAKTYLADPGTNGFISKASIPPNNTATRTFTNTDGTITITHGDGVAGNPVFNTTGLTPTSRTVQGTAPIAIAGDHATHDLTADRVWSLDTNGVTYALMQQVAAGSLLGNPTASTADVQAFGLSTGLAFVSVGTGIFALKNSSPLSDLSVTSPLDLTGTTLSAPGFLYTNTGPGAVDLGALTNGTLQQTVSGGASTVSAFAGTSSLIPFYAANSQLAQDSSFGFDTTNHRLAAGNAIGINGVGVPINSSLVAGTTTNADRDRVTFFLGGGSLGATGTGDNTLFDIDPAATNVRSGVTAGIYATQRIRSLTYTGVSSPNITEAASLYIDGKPFLSGLTVTTASYALHVAGGTTKLDGALQLGSITGPGVLAVDGSGNVSASPITETIHYLMDIPAWPISQGWLSTSQPNKFYNGIPIEYPGAHAAKTVTLIANLITNGLTSAGVTAVITQNGSNVIGAVFNMSTATTPGVYSSGPITLPSSAATDTFGVQWNNSATGSVLCAFTVIVN